ncbi:ATP-grasp fold amidoligase family protein [Paenibacillus sp. JDR-2]|uniref:ATP-grasp fold amidoligase family protein n=1 Tax=Paenibacillus sp. (strain JDR-2) TaxID=324057 RepID=UPI000166B2B9|nr:ATP-grasp fold amidoligase family protein [Paenibacillus sp. JDR-2]ACS99092.1 glycosyltransferase [Paenibacillus sp. JDR-2]
MLKILKLIKGIVMFRLMKILNGSRLISNENKVRLNFYINHGYKLNLNYPKTLSEKIHWIKINGKLTRFSDLVDKYEVRRYVGNIIGEEYLIPLIGVYENSRKIDFNKLPKEFIIKATHSSGWNLIVSDKSKLNWSITCRKIDKWINASFYRITGEENYKNIRGRVVIEELIHDDSGDLKDYKFFCYHGEPKYVQLDGGRYNTHKRDMYDTDWNKINVRYGYNNFDTPIEKPKMLDLMVELSRKLSKGFAFVRVDLYCVNESEILFGEMTFTPGNGARRFSPIEYDQFFGEPLILEKYNQGI